VGRRREGSGRWFLGEGSRGRCGMQSAGGRQGCLGVYTCAVLAETGGSLALIGLLLTIAAAKALSWVQEGHGPIALLLENDRAAPRRL
jgi:hypothetical protein